MQSVNRIPPRAAPNLYKTYELLRPKATHYRTATCAEVDCRAMANGWITTADTNTALGVQQANYIRLRSGLHFTADESAVLLTGLVSFTFPAGQKCFAAHTVPLERDPLYIVRNGWQRETWQALREHRTHAHGAHWVEEFQEGQQAIIDAQARG